MYLLPAVVGAGRGDVEEVRAAAWALRGPGIRLHLCRPPGIVWPIGAREIGSWPVPRVERTLRHEGERAMTVSPAFGVTAAPAHPGPFGRAGPWAPFVTELEALYGADRVLHLSLEEFGRNLSAAEQEAERWREGGRSWAEIRARRRRIGWVGQVARMRRLYRKYRTLDRENLLALIPTFVPSPSFRRDFPEMIECGPIPVPRRARAPERRVPRAPDARAPARWFWYASPSTSPTLLEGLKGGSTEARRPLQLWVRSPRPFPSLGSTEPVSVRPVDPLDRPSWERLFRGSDLRIVTGSRSLLEALELGGPFLYFNGVGGRGASRRAHRPEKLRRLLELWRNAGVSRELCADLWDFARERRVPAIVRRALTDRRWRDSFPKAPIPAAFPAPYDRADGLLRAIASGWTEAAPDAGTYARLWRSRSGEFPRS